MGVDNATSAKLMHGLRLILLAGLIGNKRHHSYDEVMTASHAIPMGSDKNVMRYNSPHNYADVLQELDKLGLLTDVLEKTLSYTGVSFLQSHSDPKYTTVYQHLKKKEGYKGNKNPLQEAITTYIIRSFHLRSHDFERVHNPKEAFKVAIAKTAGKTKSLEAAAQASLRRPIIRQSDEQDTHSRPAAQLHQACTLGIAHRPRCLASQERRRDTGPATTTTKTSTTLLELK